MRADERKENWCPSWNATAKGGINGSKDEGTRFIEGKRNIGGRAGTLAVVWKKGGNSRNVYEKSNGGT